MNDRDLKKAYEEVKGYYVGQELTEKRVLAAYLRAAGLSPNGDAWLTAKTAYEAGNSFREAVNCALEGGWDFRRPVTTQPKTSSPCPKTDPEGATGGIPEKPAAAEPKTLIRPVSPAPKTAGSTEVNIEPQILSAPSIPRRTNGDGGTEPLEWYPKVCGPGDLIGEGARKLLGQPKVSPVALLVRETAQNSWDARIGSSLDFTMNLRTLTKEQLRVLRSGVLTGGAGGLGLDETLANEEVWVLEICDRGSKGLGGPVRPDLPLQPGEPMDFVNMVFNIGAPSDRRLGGGTYGFGKAVGYLTSGCGTTVVWSHTLSSSGSSVESRLIASAIGDGWEDEDQRYTGRHWWGVVDPEGRIGPATGLGADRLARAIFESHFQAGETGTSILIIDPVLGGKSREADARMLCEAVLWNLWPKMVPLPDGTVPMSIHVLLNGEPVKIGDPRKHPLLAPYVDCLLAVRGAVAGQSINMPLGEVREIWQQRPRRLLGHLAMKRFASFVTESIESDIDPLQGSSHHVCLMRHAELVVTYDELRGLNDPGYHWAAVFQPVEETDSAFSAAEPPAHDEWIPTSIGNREQKSVVTVALRNIREKCNAFAAPSLEQIDTTETSASTPVIHLANSLSGLVSGAANWETIAVQPKNSGRRSKRNKPRLDVEVQSHRLFGPSSPNRMGVEISLLPVCAGIGPFRLNALIRAIDESKAKYEIDGRLVIEWESIAPIERVDGDPASVVFTEVEPISLRVIYPDDITLDFDFSVSEKI